MLCSSFFFFSFVWILGVGCMSYDYDFIETPSLNRSICNSDDTLNYTTSIASLSDESYDSTASDSSIQDTRLWFAPFFVFILVK